LFGTKLKTEEGLADPEVFGPWNSQLLKKKKIAKLKVNIYKMLIQKILKAAIVWSDRTPEETSRDRKK